MKIVNEKHHVVKSSWDLQEYSIFDSYKLSPYVVIFPQNDKEELWYNMLTGELLLLEKDEINDTDIYIRLIKHWYYINIKFDPKTIADIVYQFVKKLLENNKSSKPDKYIVTSTYACNARCFYCYENTLKQKSMTDEMALEIAKYLVKKAQDKDNKINIGWFGGEPLCGANAIRIIVKHLTENNIQFKSSMITNGYLINEFPIKEIKREWNLISCQITLDGTKENYQKIKNFKNEDENAYEKVLSNIETLLENGVFVNIRLNVGKDNAEDLFKLTKCLVERFKEYGRLLCIYTSPLFEGIESNFMIMEVPDSMSYK